MTSTGNTSISNDEGASTVIVNAGASVAKGIELGDGDYNLTFNGGGSTDTLTFQNGSEGLVNSTVGNLENMIIDSGGDISFGGPLIASDTLTVINGGILAIDSPLIVTGNLVVETGVLSFEDGTLTVLGTVDIGAAATIEVLLEAVESRPLDLAILLPILARLSARSRLSRPDSSIHSSLC